MIGFFHDIGERQSVPLRILLLHQSDPVEVGKSWGRVPVFHDMGIIMMRETRHGCTKLLEVLADMPLVTQPCDPERSHTLGNKFAFLMGKTKMCCL